MSGKFNCIEREQNNVKVLLCFRQTQPTQTLQHTPLYQFQNKMPTSGDNTRTVSLKITHHYDPTDIPTTSLNRV